MVKKATNITPKKKWHSTLKKTENCLKFGVSKGFQFMSYCGVVGGRLPELRQKILAPIWDESESVSHLVVSDSLRPHGLQPIRLLCPWDSLGKNTGEDCCFLIQGTLLTQGLNLGLPHCRQILYCLSHGMDVVYNLGHKMILDG